MGKLFARHFRDEIATPLISYGLPVTPGMSCCAHSSANNWHDSTKR